MKAQMKPVPEYQEFKNWRDVDLTTQWRWPNFSPEEIACRGTGKLVIHATAMDKLQHLRTKIGKPLILNSAYRSPEHNGVVGGEPNSYHMAKRTYDGEGVMAFDISMANHEPYAFIAAAEDVGFRGFGHYPLTKTGRHNFLHIDNGPKRAWPSATGWFQKAIEKPVEVPKRFDAEPAKPTVVETLFNKETAAVVVSGAGAMGLKEAVANPANPLAWAIGFGIIALIVGLGIYFFRRSRISNSITKPGTGD